MTSRPYPEARRVLAAAEAFAPISDPDADPGAAITRERSRAREEALSQAREDVALVQDLAAGEVPVRLYWPAGTVPGAAPSAVIVHLHGGGFVFNDVEVHDPLARRLANRSGLAVVSIDYRRPPEHRYPAAPDDVDTVLDWLGAAGPGLGLDPHRVLLHGDSAGACLALVAALRHPGRFAALALIYPFIDASLSQPSWREATDDFGLPEGRWYWQQYASSPADHDLPDFSPAAAADLSGLPPTLIVTAEFDPCRDEGEALAQRIAEAGPSVVALRALGLIHGFYRHVADYHAAETTLRQVAVFLDQHGS